MLAVEAQKMSEYSATILPMPMRLRARVGAAATVTMRLAAETAAVMAVAIAVDKHMPDGQLQNAQYSQATNVAFVVLLIVGIVAGLLLWDNRRQADGFSYVDRILGAIRGENHDKLLADTLATLDQGDYSGAASSSKALLSELPSDSVEFYIAHSVLEVATFFAGSREEQRKEGIRLVKQTYLNAQTDFEKALQVNELLGYIMAGREQFVIDEIFTGEPFGSFYDPNDWIQTIKNLAEHSISLHPTPEAVFRIGFWNTEKLVVGLRAETLTDEERDMYVQGTLDAVAEAERIYPEYLARMQGRALSYMITPRYYFWRGYLLRKVAIVEPEYAELSVRADRDLLISYETTLDQYGNRLPLIAARIPYMRFDRATYLIEHKRGPEIVMRIKNDLDEIMALIRENPAAHEGHFVSLIRTQASLSESERQEANSYLRFARVARLHEPFKTFLEGYGMEFE
jgi:hypothetical protein